MRNIVLHTQKQSSRLTTSRAGRLLAGEPLHEVQLGADRPLRPGRARLAPP